MQRPQAGWGLPTSQASTSVNGGSSQACTGPWGAGWTRLGWTGRDSVFCSQPRVQSDSTPGVLVPRPA